MSEEFVFDTAVIYPRDPSATTKRIEEYKEYYKVKYQICKHFNPKTIAEIGVRAGYSAWTFLQSCPNAKYIGIDANNGTHGGQGGTDGSFYAWARKILTGYDCEFIETDTQAINSLPFSEIDFFHVDGDHTSKGVMHDLDLAARCLSPKGVILVDDLTYINSVADGVKQWLNDNTTLDGNYCHFETKFIPSLRGELLIWKNSK